MSQDSSHRVALIVDEGSNPFELGCVTELFGPDRPEVGGRLYDLRICMPEESTSMRDGLFRMEAAGSLADAEGATTIVVPNRPDIDRPSDQRVLGVIRAAHARGARLVGLCTGAFTLAEAGVLDGRRATVHWQLLDDFRRRFPRVRVEENVLYVDDGDVLTSAGSAAALDLGLEIIRQDHGFDVATAVARRLVFPGDRAGGQRQVSERPMPRPALGDSLAPTLDWARGQELATLSVTALAEHAGISVATLHRRFRSQAGTTPLAWLTGERLAVACRLLERGESRMEVVARESGLGTGASLRATMRRRLGCSPSEYRRRFW